MLNMPKGYWKKCFCAVCICGTIILALNVSFNTKLYTNRHLGANKLQTTTDATAHKANPGNPSWINNVSIYINISTTNVAYAITCKIPRPKVSRLITLFYSVIDKERISAKENRSKENIFLLKDEDVAVASTFGRMCL